MDELNKKNDKLISIQDAIDAFYLQSDDDGWWCGTAEDMEKLLKSLPPTQPEPQWIPVSERLPEVDEDVWVTDDAGGLATVHGDSCGRYEDTGEKFWYTSQNVTAWMPMIIPEPYKGDDAV